MSTVKTNLLTSTRPSSQLLTHPHPPRFLQEQDDFRRPALPPRDLSRIGSHAPHYSVPLPRDQRRGGTGGRHQDASVVQDRYQSRLDSEVIGGDIWRGFGNDDIHGETRDGLSKSEKQFSFSGILMHPRESYRAFYGFTTRAIHGGMGWDV